MWKMKVLLSVKDQYEAIASRYQLPHDAVILINEQEDLWLSFSLQSRLLYSKLNKKFEISDKMEAYLFYFLLQVHPNMASYEDIERYLLQTCRQSSSIELLRKKTTALRKNIKKVLNDGSKQGLIKTHRSQGYYIDNQQWKKNSTQAVDIPLLASISPDYYHRIMRHLQELNDLIRDALILCQEISWGAGNRPSGSISSNSDSGLLSLTLRQTRIQNIRLHLGQFEKIKSGLLSVVPLKPEDTYRLQLEAKLAELKTYIGLAGFKGDLSWNGFVSTYPHGDYQQTTWMLFDHIKRLLWQAFQSYELMRLDVHNTLPESKLTEKEQLENDQPEKDQPKREIKEICGKESSNITRSVGKNTL